jgi:hypothetical protein
VNGWAKVSLIISWLITFWVITLGLSAISCFPPPEEQGYKQQPKQDARDAGDRLSNGNTPWVTVVIPAGAGLLGAVLGAIVSYISAEKIRRRKSIYDIADVFAKRALEWAEKRYRPTDLDYIIWHNEMIDALSPNVDYLKRRHKEVCQKIWPHWTFFHGGNAGEPITHQSYYHSEAPNNVPRNWIPKDEWSLALYSIADILRES